MINKIFPRKLNGSSDSRLRQPLDMVDALNVSVTEDFDSSGNEMGGDVGVLKPVKGNEVIQGLVGLSFTQGPVYPNYVEIVDGVPTANFVTSLTLDEVSEAVAAGGVENEFGDIVYTTPTLQSFNQSTLDDVLEFDEGSVSQGDPIPQAVINTYPLNEQRVLGSVTDDVLGVIFFFVWSKNKNEQGVYAYDRDGVLPSVSTQGNPAGRYRKILANSKFNFNSTGFVKGDTVHLAKKSEGYDKTVMLYFTDNENEPRKLDVFTVLTSNYSNYQDVDFNDLITACPKTPLYPITFNFTVDPDRNVSNFSKVPGMQFAYQHIYKGGVESAISTYSRLAIPSEYSLSGANVPTTINQNVCYLQTPDFPERSKEVQKVRFLVRFGDIGSFKIIDELDVDVLDAFDFGYPFYNDRVLVNVFEEDQNNLFNNLPRRAEAQAVASDRLIYGNYVEGFDEVDTSGATITAVYKERPDAELDLDVLITPFLIQPKNHDAVGELGRNKVAGYKINTSAFPNVLELNSIITINFTVSPSSNFHLYDQTNSFHGSGQVATNTYQNFNQPGADLVGSERKGHSFFGNNDGVCLTSGSGIPSAGLTWNFFDGTNDAHSIPAVFGTSAANPLILKKPSGGLNFAVSLQVVEAIETDAPAALRDIIKYYLAGEGQDDSRFTSIVVNSTAEYNIDLGLQNDDTIDVISGNDTNKDLIVAVKNANDSAVEHQNPIGYFILNKATVEVGLKSFDVGDLTQDELDVTSSSDLILGLDVKSIEALGQNEVVDVMTCVPYLRRYESRGQTPHSEPSEQNGQDVKPRLTNFSEGVGVNMFNATISSRNAPDAIFENLSIYQWRVFSRSYISQTASSNWKYIGANSPVDASDVNGFHLYENVVWQENIPTLFSFAWTNPDNPGPNFDAAEKVISRDYTYAGQFNGAIQKGNRGKISGFLNFDNGIADDMGGLNTPMKLFVSSEERSEIIDVGNSVIPASVLSCFSLIDGEGSMESNINAYHENRTGSITGFIVFAGHICSSVIHKSFNYGHYVLEGSNTPAILSNSNPGDNSGVEEKRLTNTPFLKFMQYENPEDDTNSGEMFGLISGTIALSVFANGALTNYRNHQRGLDGEAASQTPDMPNLYFNITPTGEQESWVEISSNNTEAILGSAGSEFRSFKTKANHEFGIVYYDERGRSGNVNYLGNLYVAGYSSMDLGRGLNTGRVEVEVGLNHNPPDWASDYQIVYAGNTSVEDFVQYTVGSAFLDLKDSPEPEEGVETINPEGVIYVSLGLLQGDNGISYTDSFGAVNEQGTKDIYTYSVGDKLRVISYHQNDGTTVVYPNGYDFDVVGVKSFNASTAENPFYNEQNTDLNNDTIVHPAKVGEFLILKNNPFANGFRYDDVLAAESEGSYEGESDLHNWNNRTVVEIYSPKKSRDADERVYHEIGEVHQVVNNNHIESLITLTQGDVFWRRIPLNFARYDSGDELFKSIPQIEDQQSNFQSWWAETKTFSDLFAGTNVSNFGKPKIIAPNSEEIRRRSSITYSDKTNYSSNLNRFTQFNASLLNFKDIPNEYGAINFLLDNYDSLFIIQESKCSVLPVSRNIISTASGEESLTTSNQVLGTQKFYAGDYGCDNNPESVSRVGTNIYFASKSSKEVYKFNASKGIEVISEKGMKKFFYNLFQDGIVDARDNDKVLRVVGGYDPLNDEYLLSVYTIEGVDESIEGAIDSTDFETVEDLQTQIDDLQDALSDAEDTTNELQDLYNDAILQIETGQAFTLTPVKYFQILNAGGAELDSLTGVPSFSTKIRLDTDGDGTIGVSDLLSLLAVYGQFSSSEGVENDEPEVPINTDEQGNIIIG